jgi:choline kinase/GT2 family glycosyltransferase/predicted Zn-dependent protease
MKAIILNAGKGGRLAPHTDETPKCLLNIGQKKLIDYQLDGLRLAGIRDIVMVVGYRHEQIRDYVSIYGDLRFTFIENKDYASTNTAYSLWLARNEMTDDFIYCNGDVIFHPELVRRLASSASFNALAVERKKCGDEEVKVLLDGKRIVSIGKQIGSDNAYGEFIGIAKFSKNICPAFIKSLEALAKNEATHKDYFEAALQNMLPEAELTAVDISDLPCVEIDFPEDLVRAAKEIAPLIEDSRDRKRHKILFYVERNLHLPFLEPIYDYMKAHYNYELAFYTIAFVKPQGGQPGQGLEPEEVKRLSRKAAIIKKVEDFEPDLTVVADVSFNLKGAGRIVNVGHGLISKGGFYRDAPIVRRENQADMICAPGQWHKDILQKNVFSPIVVTGFIKSDRLFGSSAFTRASFCEHYGIAQDKKIILFAPTFNEELSAIPCIQERITELCDDETFVVIKLHNMTDEKWVKMYKNLARWNDNIRFIEDIDVSHAMAAADVMVSDVSSVIVEFMLLDKPVVVFDNPKQREYPFFAPDDIEYKVRDACISVKSVEELKLAVKLSLARPDELSDKRRQYSEKLCYGRDGKCAERTAQGIVQLLEGAFDAPKAKIEYAVFIVSDNVLSQNDVYSFVKRINASVKSLSYEIFFVAPKPYPQLSHKYNNINFAEYAGDIAAGLNNAVSASNGDYLVFVDRQTNIPDNWLKRMSYYFRWYPDTGIVSAFSEKDNYMAVLNKIAPGRNITDLSVISDIFSRSLIGADLFSDNINSGCFMITRTAYLNSGKLNFSKSFDSALSQYAGVLKDKGLSLRYAPDVFTYRDAAQLEQRTASSILSDTTAKQIDTLSAGKSILRKEFNRGMTSIVILTFNQLEFTKQCIDSIRKHTPEPHEIIFVDNGSTDGTVKWLKGLLKGNANYKLIENKQNFGFAKGCNQGIEASAGEYILLLNNDVIVTQGWLSAMFEHLSSSVDIGIVGPMTNNISGFQKVVSADYELKDLDSYAKSFHEQNRYRRVFVRRVVGFCMLFNRDLIDKVGMLDEQFGSGNFEDDDLCLRAALQGYKNVIAGDVFIHHFGSQSFKGNKINYDEALSRNKKLFVEKWSGLDITKETGKKFILLNALEKADMLNQKGMFKQSVDMLMEGIKRCPESKEGYYRLAEILIENKSFSDAIEALSVMPETIEPDDKKYTLLGFCKEGLELNDEAEDLADKALKINSNYSKALNLKGVVALKRGDLKAAEEYLNRAIDCDKSYGEAYSNLGVLRWSQQRHDEGLRLFERAFILSPTSGDILANYKEAAFAGTNILKTEGLLRDAIAIFPFNKRLKYSLIEVLIQQDKTNEAMSEIEGALVDFGVADDSLSVALEIRNAVGPMEIPASKHKNTTVSLCMIVKNEEKYLAKCLKSAKPIVDEMIVVDTGSTDRTKDIAKAFGAKVYDFKWTNDFSEARNFSLSKASGGWIFVLDGDEVVSPQDYQLFRHTVEKKHKHKTAYEIITRNYINNAHVVGWRPNDGKYAEETATGWKPSVKVRLFPNDKGIRFDNPVHELVEESLKKLNISTKLLDVVIHHYGKLSKDKLVEKGKDYYSLGEKKREGDELDGKALYELAVQAVELEQYDKALQLWHEFLKLYPDSIAALRAIGSAHYAMDNFHDSLVFSKKAYDLAPTNRDVIIMYATAEVAAGDPKTVINVVGEHIKNGVDDPLFFALLAVAYACIGDKKESFENFKRITKKGFSSAIYFHDTAQKLIKAGRLKCAITILENALENKDITQETPELLADCYKKLIDESRSENG